LLRQQGRGCIKFVQGDLVGERAAWAVVQALLPDPTHRRNEQSKKQFAVQVRPGSVRQAVVGRLIPRDIVVAGYPKKVRGARHRLVPGRRQAA
jgi:hypothetical protein